MTGYFNAGNKARLGSIGASLLAASGRLPAHVSRSSLLGQGFQQAQVAGRQAEQYGMAKDMHNLELANLKLNLENRLAKQAWLANYLRNSGRGAQQPGQVIPPAGIANGVVPPRVPQAPALPPNAAVPPGQVQFPGQSINGVLPTSIASPQPPPPISGYGNGRIDPALLALDEDAGIAAILKQQSETWPTAKDVNGRLRYTGGPRSGELAFAGVTDNSFASPEGKKFADLARMEERFGSTHQRVKDFRKAITNDAAKLTDESSLRGQFIGLAGDFRKVKGAFERIDALSGDASAAGDLGLVFNLMKMFDPGSVVRESEFATAQNAAGVPDRIRNVFNRVRRGERLNPAQRMDFQRVAGKLVREAARAHIKLEDQFKSIAELKGMMPEVIALDFVGRLRDSDVMTADNTTPTVPDWAATIINEAGRDVMDAQFGTDGNWYLPPVEAGGSWLKVVKE